MAIKEVLPGTADAAARLAREALITANLQHPGIVPVYEVGRWAGGEPFYAMKLVAGRSLRDVVAEAPDLAARLALLPHVVAVAEALAYAHEHGVIHRDLKPLNVIVGDFGESPPRTACAFTRMSNDGKWAVVIRSDSSGADGVAWLVDARDGRVRAALHHDAVLKDAAFSPDDKLVATPSLGGDTVVWRIPDGSIVHRLPGEGHVVSARFSPDGVRLAAGTSEGTAILYDVASGRRWGRYETGTHWIDVAFSDDGRLLATAGLSGLAYVWDVSGPSAVTPLAGPTKRVRMVAYAPDGRSAAVVSDDAGATLRDAATGAVKLDLRGHTDGVMWAEFAPDGRRLVTASRDGTALLWDAAGGDKLATFAGHTGTVRRATFRP